MARSAKNLLREAILRKRGLTKGKRGKLQLHSKNLKDTGVRKTLAMRLIEQTYNQPIENLIQPDRPLNEVAEVLGIDSSTLSKWRSYFKLRSMLNGQRTPGITGLSQVETQTSQGNHK